MQENSPQHENRRRLGALFDRTSHYDPQHIAPYRKFTPTYDKTSWHV